MGLTQGSYEAYCFDQAVWYLGSWITNKLEKVGAKKDRKAAANEAARKRVLDRILLGDKAKSQFADPAAFFTS
ncbi:hypothetical protein PBI_TRISCUIT_48 [Microbacterium phage Triscuit]|nr:hypothetical protein PBI_TRISCUIT_48 [Microbacterium phage Triscuit]